jgi:hypothetical protein
VKSIILLLFFLTSSLFAYSDQDIDGVDDSVDLCPNTPFDVIVNENGCDINKKFLGKLTFQIGTDISFDRISDKTTTLNLYLNYNYAKWDLSLSSSNYNTTNLTSTTTAEDDLYLTLGYLFQYNKLRTKLSIGTKFAFMDDDNISRDNDYYTSLNFDYTINEKQNLFLYYNYTISGDSNTLAYSNIHTYSIGSGYMINDKWYSALAYNYSDALYKDTKDYRSISWLNVYTLSKNYYISCNYAYTLNDSTYDHLISLNIGVMFE